tara:strand:- start:1256 stop:1408 length:153 start_codon:yes stop_codon:yes gene_type:complete
MHVKYNDKKEITFISEDMILFAQRGLCDQKLINKIVKYLKSINKKIKYLN